MQVNARSRGPTSPLSAWLADPAAEARFRRHVRGRAAAVLAPRDRAWRRIVPAFSECRAAAASGLPFQIVADRRYDRSGDPRRLAPALAAGKTVFLPQIHQVLPRLARLMVALRATFVGPGREESSFLFLTQGRGREGMGLHHDGAVEAFWLQLEGRRSVTLGPPVRRGTPLDLPDARARNAGPGWRTLDLAPGTLLYLPERTPHRVVYHGRSVAVSLTWGKRRRVSRAQALTEWDVVSGRAAAIPPVSSTLWTQLPAVAGPLRRATRHFSLHLPDGQKIHLPTAARPATARLPAMPSWRGPLGAAEKRELVPLIEAGILAPRDLPLRLIVDNPRTLDGWRFA